MKVLPQGLKKGGFLVVKENVTSNGEVGSSSTTGWLIFLATPNFPYVPESRKN